MSQLSLLPDEPGFTMTVRPPTEVLRDSLTRHLASESGHFDGREAEMDRPLPMLENQPAYCAWSGKADRIMAVVNNTLRMYCNATLDELVRNSSE